MNDLCTVNVEQSHGITSVRLVGELDMSNAARVASELQGICGAVRTLLVLDLDGLEYVDSAGLAALDRFVRESGSLVVLGDDATIRETLAVAGFDKARPIFPTREALPAD